MRRAIWALSLSAAFVGMATISEAETVARLHWLGKRAVAADTNAVNVMRIWNEPETTRLDGVRLCRARREQSNHDHPDKKRAANQGREPAAKTK